MRDVQAESGVADFAAIAAGHAARAVLAHRGLHLATRVAKATLGENLNHTAHRIGTIECRNVAARDFDALDLAEHYLSELRGTAGGRSDPDAVNKDQRRGAAAAAHEHRAGGADAAVLHELQPGLALEQLDQVGGLGLADFLLRDDRGVRDRLVKLLLDTTGGDDHGFGGFFLRHAR